MNQSFFKTVLLSGAMACAVFTMSAADKPTFWVPGDEGTPMWTGMSDNGKWGVANVAPSTDGSTDPVAAVIYDIDKRTQVRVEPKTYTCRFNDVTDDGKIVVGSSEGSPAYYNTQTRTWTTLPGLGKGWTVGQVLKVTPDGKYAVGISQPTNDEWGNFYGTMWDLEKGETVTLGSNAPYLDTNGDDSHASRISSVSPDGRWLIFEISWYQAGGWSALYDRTEDKVYPLGLEYKSNGSLGADSSGFVGASEPVMSNNGKYITGTTHTIQDMGDYDNITDYSFLYDIDSHKMTVYGGEADSDVLSTVVLNDGVVLACQPALNPAREMIVRHGNYFYPMSDVYRQAYDVNLEQETDGVGIVTGTPFFASNDGRTWLVMATANKHDCYLVTFPESISEACDRVNLLRDYRVTPASGSTFSELSLVTVAFDRPIGITGSARQIRLLDEDGTAVAQAQNVSVAEDTRLSFNFRPTMLESGKTYTITLPEGFVIMNGDSNMKAPEIKITYNGRREGRIALTNVTPPDNTVMAEFSLSTSPVTLSFDADVAINESVLAQLYRSGSDVPVSSVLLQATGNNVIVYPSVAQHFFEGYDYTIEIPENSITDLSGQGGNEAITLHYTGSYTPEQNPDDRYIWRETFGDGGYDGMLFYEGDHNEPGDVPFNWGFTADTTPWLFLRGDENSSDWCIGSHSMYERPGKSDDWFTSTQLYIPDANCFLRLEAQSYLKSKEDHLKIYILATDDIYQYADKEYIERFKKEGDLIADITLDPGATQEGLAGEWTEYTYDLEKYAQKNIYIAFCNDNENQSAIFVDNVCVEHDLSFFTSFTHDTYVENKESIIIEPVVTIGSALTEFVALDAILLDSDNKQIDSFNLKDQNLVENDVVRVKFTKPLPLKKGQVNDYTLQVSLNAKNGTVETGNVLGSVYNLTFSPKKHIVVEEYSGRNCANCPLGFAAMNNLEKTFGEAIIPVVVRTYSGDPTGSTVEGYGSFLGMNAAPSGRLNRGPISMPMISVDGDYRFSGRNLGAGIEDSDVWFDVAGDEMQITPLLEVSGAGMYNDENETISDFQIRSAIDLKGQSIGVFSVLLEDNVTLPQENNLYNVNDDDLLPWSAGGSYAKNLVIAEFNDIARAAYGETYYGSLGLIPGELKADETYTARVFGKLPDVSDMKIENCKMVLMAINTATGKVINATVSPMVHTNLGVNTVDGDIATIKAENGSIVISGVNGDFTTEAYTLDGTLAARAESNGSAVLEVPAGMVIVRVTSAEGTQVRKFIMR
ncbi:MAG: Ig-like domain-containing protein [Bacteroides sp.]|nr:Ig-like domain-containing protein [Bacteroides sp.]